MEAPTDRPQDGRRPKWRRARRWIVAAALAPLAVLAVPRSPSAPPSPVPVGAARVDPGDVLKDFWRAFEDTPENTSIEAFDRWVKQIWNDPAGPAAEFRGRGQIVQEGQGRTLTLDGPGFFGRGELHVNPRRWAVTEYALVAEDLSCVLCHVHIDGVLAPAGAFSGAPLTDHLGKRISITGGLVAGSGVALFDDPAVDLEALRVASGSLKAPSGRVASAAADGEAAATGPLHVFDTIHGHLEATGSESDPVEILGNLVVEGDLLLRGPYSGDGELFVEGNAFLPDGLRALDQSNLTLVVMGSVLVGDVLRPRFDESLSVTGDDQGSFGFLLECLARFNATRKGRPPFWLEPGQSAYRLDGTHATGDWYDPALEKLEAEAIPVGPALMADGQPWFDPSNLRETARWEAGAAESGGGPGGGPGGDPDGDPGRDSDGGPDSDPVGRTENAGLTLDATIFTPSAFIAVASGLRAAPEHSTVNASLISPGAVPAGAMLVRGSVASSHAAIHAPTGLRLVDSPVYRSMISSAFQGGIEATLESITGDGTSLRSMESGGVIQGVSVKPEGLRDRLRAPSESRPATGR